MKNDDEQPVDRELPTVDSMRIIDFRKSTVRSSRVSVRLPSTSLTLLILFLHRGIVKGGEHSTKKFEMKKQPDAHKRVQISKTGTLDTVKMMNYKWPEDVFRKTATVREGKNHIVMFIDWSGSTSDASSRRWFRWFAVFLKKVNIPFEAYAATATSRTLQPQQRYSYYV